jgi:hypothetical protein
MAAVRQQQAYSARGRSDDDDDDGCGGGSGRRCVSSPRPAVPRLRLLSPPASPTESNAVSPVSSAGPPERVSCEATRATPPSSPSHLAAAREVVGGIVASATRRLAGMAQELGRSSPSASSLLPALLAGQPARGAEATAERSGWLAQGGGSLAGGGASFRSRWCVLVPSPPPTPDGEAVRGDDPAGEGGRWLLWFESRDAGRPSGGLPLPVGCVSVRQLHPEARVAQPYCLEVSVELPRPAPPGDDGAAAPGGGSGGCGAPPSPSSPSSPQLPLSLVLSAESADVRFAWAQALGPGSAAPARVPRREEAATRQALLRLLPPPTGGRAGGGGGDARQPFDARENPADAELLRRVWVGLGGEGADFAVRAERWKDFGFQQAEPAADFRACGRCGVRCVLSGGRFG